MTKQNKFNEARITACVHGYLETVKLLLNDPEFDPADRDYYAISMATKNGHTEVVELLEQAYKGEK